jgi:hypothetical protein
MPCHFQTRDNEDGETEEDSIDSEEEEEEEGTEGAESATRKRRQTKGGQVLSQRVLRHSHLLLLALYRCDDQAPLVRTRALTLISELTANLNIYKPLVSFQVHKT